MTKNKVTLSLVECVVSLVGNVVASKSRRNEKMGWHVQYLVYRIEPFSLRT